ncbi:hypothetical protein FAM22021_002267 [Propionibacterium freudenreichii]|nr:hypothetical protein [Propionibacterium freudenreichii]
MQASSTTTSASTHNPTCGAPVSSFQKSAISAAGVVHSRSRAIMSTRNSATPSSAARTQAARVNVSFAANTTRPRTGIVPVKYPSLPYIVFQYDHRSRTVTTAGRATATAPAMKLNP